MTQQEKIILMKYLYIDDKIQKFLCNDLFQELINIIPKEKCISSLNVSDEIRRENYADCICLVREFFRNNLVYDKIVKKIFSNYEVDELEKYLLLGYVFFLANISMEEIDIFKNKKSICYMDCLAPYEIIS